MHTIQEALLWGKARLPDSESASLEAQLLLAHVLEQGRVFVIANPQHTLESDQIAHYQSLIQRREVGEPFAYIMGKRAFYTLEFEVSPDVLIPRPETEHLIEEALQVAQTHAHPIIADIGTGSGAIAVTMAVHAPHATVYATDMSHQALAVAQHNAQQNALSQRITFLQGNLAMPLIERAVRVSLLLANLPYIPTEEWRTLAVSEHEPRLALEGGDDGLDLIRELLAQVPSVCEKGAVILLEHGAGQSEAILHLAEAMLQPRDMRVIYDYAGHDRIVRLDLSP